MFNKIRSYLINVGKGILTSIGFIPTFIAIGITILVLFLIRIDSPDRAWFITDAIPFLNISYAETARELVSNFLSGTISLIIFSFTMMMFVLQQAASNYSSKIIGDIISRRSNQVVLGVYVGTIIYMILILIQIKEDEEFDQVPQLPIYFGILLFIFCVILFVKFINDIYNSVQIYQVIDRIYSKTFKNLKNFPTSKNEIPEHEKHTWYTYRAQTSGYFQDISRQSLISIAKQHDLIINAIPPKGFYHSIGEPLFKLNKEIEDKEILSNIESGFIFYSGEKISDNSFFGIRQLSEVAVQSLSTGINAPGIAIACLDYLGDLLITISKRYKTQIFRDGNGHSRLILPAIPFQEILEMCITPIRIYGRNDINVLISILNLFKRIAYNDTSLEHQDIILAHFNSVLEDGRNFLTNTLDKDSLYQSARRVQNEVPKYLDEVNLQILKN